MRVVVDGLPVSGMSLAIVVEHLLNGWEELDCDDELHLVIGPAADLAVPRGVTVQRLPFGRLGGLSRLRAQNVALRRICNEVGADILLGTLPTTAIGPLPCPRAVMAYDLRHELRPEQFPMKARLLRRVSYEIGFRQADAITTISERTRTDLLRSRPWLRRRIVRACLLGADHVESWETPDVAAPYAIAFGQYGNKNIDLVLDAWSLLADRRDPLPLTLVGLPGAARARVVDRVAGLGLSELVSVMPWLPNDEFRSIFAGASLVVFPSDFEGFGLPVVEAMRLGIPVVITPEPALLEVSGGYATVMDGWDPAALAQAVEDGRDTTSGALEDARTHAATLTWQATARATRAALAEAIQSSAGRVGRAGGGVNR